MRDRAVLKFSSVWFHHRGAKEEKEQAWQDAEWRCKTKVAVKLKGIMDGEEKAYGGCEGPDAMYVKLISSDGHEFIVKREHALTSGTIKAMLSGPDNTRADLRQQKGEINQSNARIDAMQDKMADLEDRNRCCNIRLVGLLEGVEGDDPVRFLQKEIPRWFPAMKSNGDHSSLELNRAHCTYSGGNRDSSRASTLIFQCLCYTDRQRILQAAQKSDPVIVQGRKLSFYVDYSSITAAKRRAFGEVRAKLCSLGVDNFLVYPAVLKVNHGGARLSFNTQDEVAAFLSQHFQDFVVPAVFTACNALWFPSKEKMD
ncbi:UNVERIFIED_CONTAM: hypothetical protein FKN15_005523 [Acipenser sinensis]